MISFRGRSRRAFTLIEMLAVFAIIALLIALAIPAVHAARRAVRHSRCVNHHDHRARGGQQGDAVRGADPRPVSTGVSAHQWRGCAGRSLDGGGAPSAVSIKDRPPE